MSRQVELFQNGPPGFTMAVGDPRFGRNHSQDAISFNIEVYGGGDGFQIRTTGGGRTLFSGCGAILLGRAILELAKAITDESNTDLGSVMNAFNEGFAK